MERRVHIRYENPYGGHPILRKRGIDAYQAVIHFLMTCTDWNGVWKAAEICVSGPGDYLPDGWTGAALTESLTQQIGTPRPGIMVNSLETGEQTGELVWDLARDRHAWGVELVLSQPAARRRYPDPVKCLCTADFALRHPRVKTPLAGQDATFPHIGVIRSSILLHVSAGNTSAFFDLVFPFSAADARFLAYVQAIRPHWPVRVAWGNFKLHTPHSKNEWYRTTRIKREVFDSIKARSEE